MRIALSIVVRDEVDIIEANIRHHAAGGVSRFVVTDNASVDGTRETLESLTGEFDLTIIDEPSLTIDQDLWVTRMARLLQDEGSADWVINNDADEFWLTGVGSYSEVIEQSLTDAHVASDEIGLLVCSRFNRLADLEQVSRPDYSFKVHRYEVQNNWSPLHDPKQTSSARQALYDDGRHLMIRTLPGKVITRLDGLQSVDMGNHGAVHSGQKITCDAIRVAHYPIRDYRQFEKKVRNYGSALANNKRFGERTSRHLRYWYQRYLDNELVDEYRSLVLVRHEMEALIELGIVARLQDESDLNLSKANMAAVCVSAGATKAA